MKTNYVLIDFESVQPESLEDLNHEHFKVLVFVGASQSKLRIEITTSLHQLGTRAEYIRISGSGRNALDFHIAYYIGRLAAEAESAYFHIVSKDTGFDPLIEHLRAKKILIRRVDTVDDIPIVKVSKLKSPRERVAFIQNRLQQLNAPKPRTVKTLSGAIASLFFNRLREEEVAALVQDLVKQRSIELTGTKVIYTSEQRPTLSLAPKSPLGPNRKDRR